MKLEQLKISFKKLYLREEQALILWVEQEQKLDFRGFENLKKTTMGEFSWDKQIFSWIEQQKRTTVSWIEEDNKNEERRR